MLTPNEAISYLLRRSHSLSSSKFTEIDRVVLRGICELLEKLPATADGEHVVPGMELMPNEKIDYIEEPFVDMRALYILGNGQTCVESIGSYCLKKSKGIK